jgi:chromosome segregation ATPase
MVSLVPNDREMVEHLESVIAYNHKRADELFKENKELQENVEFLADTLSAREEEIRSLLRVIEEKQEALDIRTYELSEVRKKLDSVYKNDGCISLKEYEERNRVEPIDPKDNPGIAYY